MHLPTLIVITLILNALLGLLMVDGQAIQITVGGVQRQKHHTKVQDMLLQADHALYSAKSKGRNKVIFHYPAQVSGPEQGAPA